MTDILKRAHAPVTDEAWQEIDTTAKRVLETQLSARHVVDFEGPHGWQFAAVNLGWLELGKSPGPHDVPWGTRAALPLIEVRVPVLLDRIELDNVSRGRVDADLTALEDVVRKVALFEETVVYLGFADANMQGILPESVHAAIPLPGEAADLPLAVAQAVQLLNDAGMSGPYTLILGPKPYVALTAAGAAGYPALQIIRELIGGEVRRSPALTGGVLLSIAGGDFRIVVGQDISIGYTGHDRDRVELFVTESFAFQVIEPRAAVGLQSV